MTTAAAVGADGGAVFTEVPTSITACTISDNLARGRRRRARERGLWRRSRYLRFVRHDQGCTISGNQVVGGNGGTGPFVGDAEGGAINNYGNLTISGSTFDQNQALGGSDGNSGAATRKPSWTMASAAPLPARRPPAISPTPASATIRPSAATTPRHRDRHCRGRGAEGGALYNELGSAGTLAGCTFDHNEAVGGNGDTGSGSVVLVGEGLGGAIVSGFGGNLYGPTTLTVSNSTLTQNNAQGGDNNTGSASVAGLVGTGAGAGIANYAGGTASVSGSELDHNQASGGHDNTAGGTGAVFAGARGGWRHLQFPGELQLLRLTAH